MTNKNHNSSTPNDTGPPPDDQLDAMLRAWHQDNAQSAALGRDKLVQALAEQAREDEYVLQLQTAQATTAAQSHTKRHNPFALLRNIAMNPYSRLAASLMILVALVTLFIPTPGNLAFAQEGIIMIPEGGKLEAHDDDGNLIGPCPLKHTDVNVEISGLFSRVTIKQTYQNPYQSKIEAQYTFPMSHRAAVDRMTMTVGDRVVVGEVKERAEAQRIYQAARAQGYVASLLEQERPNIFTQSIANIEPQAQVIVEISYVEVLESKDGEFAFDFPMVVGPRYIPGASMTSPAFVPAELITRHGVILRGPAALTIGAAGNMETLGSLQTGKLNALLSTAQPITYPGNTWWGKGDPTGGATQPTVWYRFEAEYTDKSKEFGQLYTDGTGQINGRWFYTDPTTIKDMGTGFSTDTNQVPDASRITPEPVKPGTRPGHDISVKVTIDTGGPGIIDLKSMLHKIDGGRFVNNLGEPPSKVTIELANDKEIPNRDFVLNWKTSSNAIQEAKLTHAGENGGFFTLILQPPDRVMDADIAPRELVFVMDTSGSMNGYPIEKSKEVMNKAIDAMRQGDTFNIITFAGSTDILWSEPKPATADNRAAAQSFINSRSGQGGTEMMTAINKALVQTVSKAPDALTPEQLTELPTDGRSVTLRVPAGRLMTTSIRGLEGNTRVASIKLANGQTVFTDSFKELFNPTPGRDFILHGTWTQKDLLHKDDLYLKIDRIETSTSINTSLAPTELANLPADGRSVIVDALINGFISTNSETIHIPIKDGLFIVAISSSDFSIINHKLGETLRMTGKWETLDGRRILSVTQAKILNGKELLPAKPMRIVLFLTDGYVGNDMAIIDAVKKNANTTRVFSFGIGNSVNRWLLQGMANAGRGEAEFVLLESDSDAAVERLSKRIQTPVLTDIKLAFSDGLEVTDVIPPLDSVPDLFDVKPLIIHGRYSKAGTGTLTIVGNTGSGAYEREVDLEFALDNKEHDVISTLWARAKVEQILNKDLKAAQEKRFPTDLTQQIVKLGEEFQIMTQFTSFVAVEKSRITIGGEPVLVAVPIEMPDRVSFEGIFGQLINDAVKNQDVYLGERLYSDVATDMGGFDDALYRLGKGISDNSQAISRGLSSISALEDSDSIKDEKLPARNSTLRFNKSNSPRKQPPTAAPVNTQAPKPTAPASESKRSAGRRRKIDSKGKKGLSSNESIAIQATMEKSPGRRDAPASTPTAGFAGGFGGGGKAPEPNFNSAMNQGATGLYRMSGDKVAKEQYKNGNMILRIEQSQQTDGKSNLGTYRYGFENARSNIISSGENPPLSKIPMVSKFFSKTGIDPRLSLPSDAKDDENGATFGEPIGGEVNVYLELKDIAAAHKVKVIDAPNEILEADASGSIEIAETQTRNRDAQLAQRQEAGTKPATGDDRKVLLDKAAEDLDALKAKVKDELQTSSEQIKLPLLTHLFSRAGRPMLANEVAIIIGQFMGADEYDTASQLTNELVEYLPDYEYATKLREAFTNEALDADQKKQAVIEIAGQAYDELNEILFAAYIETRLQNVLEDSLYQKLAALPLDENRPEDKAARTDDALLVSVILSSVDDEVIDAVQEAGLTIIAKPRHSLFVVGEINQDKLAHLAVIESVKWIEPAKVTKQ